VFWTCLLVFLLLLLAAALERLTQRPFLATRTGETLALLLRGRRLGAHLFEVPGLPAVGFRAAAQTWGETVLVTPGLLAHPRGARTLAHEACHVAQYRRLGSFGFWGVYLAGWLRGLVVTRSAFRAYWELPLEREARRAAEKVDEKAV